jgi:hypothetical protein
MLIFSETTKVFICFENVDDIDELLNELLDKEKKSSTSGFISIIRSRL